MPDYAEILLRLLAATLIGCILGLDRNLHGKPTGMKTHGLVALGAALVVMASLNFDFRPGAYDGQSVSRAIQGLITGIGFLGAGVIVHGNGGERVRGLTTAASIWVTAAVGIVCGNGAWRVAGMVTAIVLLLFVVGRPLERSLHRRWLAKSDDERDTINRHDE
ncbi:MAG: MgtC/SapB family protein [Pseudomonadota bacterium]